MEIRAYLKFLRHRWWIIAAVLLLTVAATYVITLNTPLLYQAKTTYLVTVSSAAADPKSRLSALDLLSNRYEIAGTYAQIANSRTIRLLAAKELGLSSAAGLPVSSQIVSGSNVLEISVTGSDPGQVQAFANAIGHQTANYVQDLSESYELNVLDAAGLPGSPVEPKMSANITLGVILGLALGLALAILVEYLQVPANPGTTFNILDERTGIHNMPYLIMRLRQEMSRAKRTSRFVSLALVNVDHGGLIGQSAPQLRVKALRSAATILGPYLRTEDVMASFGDSTLALLLPDANGSAAKSKVEKLIERLCASPAELNGSGTVVNFHAAAGIATYRREKMGEEKTTEELFAEAESALHTSESAIYGGVGTEADGNAPEHMGDVAEGALTD
jgi:protein tyrosine kinase modulator